LAAILAAATLLTLMIANLVTLAEINAARPAIAHTRAVQAVLTRTRATLVDAETGQRGFLLLGDPGYLEPLERAEASLPGNLAEMRALTTNDSSQQRRIQDLERLAVAKMGEVRRSVELFQRGEAGEALALVRSNQGKSLMDSVRRAIEELRAQEERQLEERTVATRHNLEVAMWIDAGAGLGLLILGFILYAIHRDIARREALEVALRESAAFQERFVGILGHDLRNPLNAVSIGAELLLRREGPAQDQPATVRRIAASAGRMRRMVDQLLDLTRARLAGGIPVTPRAGTNLAEVARNAVEEIRIAHPDAQVTLEAAPEIKGKWDPDRLAQLVSNLVANAIQHGAGTPVEVLVKNGGPVVVLEVHNGGSPIPTDLQRRLFDPFRRGAEGAAAQAQGLGLGLFITQQIVQAHSGTIDVESTDGSGTTFRITLPSSRP
jgi:signal transduction histidine kinase